MKLVTVAFFASSFAWAQSPWFTSTQRDGQTARERETFILRGSYRSSSIVRPTFTLVCESGKMLTSSFNTFLVTREGETGKTGVTIRIGEKKQEFKAWKSGSGLTSLYPDSGFVKKLVSADRVDIEFTTSSSARMTADFEPSPAGAPLIRKACGIH
jgi:hypothetical protein